MRTRAHLLELETPIGWHVFVPRGAVWFCPRCSGFVPDPSRWRELGELCPGFLLALPSSTSATVGPELELEPAQLALW